MKRLFFSIICFAFCIAPAMAATDSDDELTQLTQEFLSHYDGQLPQGVFLNEDSTSVTINLQEFIADPAAKRYFEQMGNAIIAGQIPDNEAQVKIKDMQLNEIPQKYTKATTDTNGPAKAVAVPQVTFCLTIPYTYMSVDGKNNPIRLSSVMYRPSPFQLNYTASLGASSLLTSWGQIALFVQAVKGLWNAAFGYTFDYGVLCCHPTVTTSDEAPTGKDPLGGDVYMFCSDYAIVVCPDYCGYGLSGYRQHPYLVQGVTARNVVDGYIAALDLIKNKKAAGASGSWQLADDFYTDLMGYSQGGSVALATLRYLESGQVSQSDLDRINLRNTYCGDGPYSPRATVEQYLEWSNLPDEKYSNMAYTCVLPLIVQAAKDAYDNDCMHTVELESYFTEKFLATGIISDLDSKRVPTWKLNEKSAAAGTLKIHEIMSDKMIKRSFYERTGEYINEFNTESNEYKCLMRAFEYNDLAKGWTPQHPILFMHLNGDLVVPYCNMKEVERNLPRDPNVKVVFTDPYKVRYEMLFHSLGWLLLEEVLKDTLTNPDHGSVGVFFYMAAASGIFNIMLK